MKIVVASFAVLAGIALGACGSDDSPAAAGDELPTASPAEAAERAMPRLTPPDRPPAGGLVKRDLIEGTGAQAKNGAEVAVKLAVIDYQTGRGVGGLGIKEPIDWELGTGSVLPGIDRGVVGMKAGGRRTLIIPPNLAFGDGDPPRIRSGATMLYVVDLLRVLGP